MSAPDALVAAIEQFRATGDGEPLCAAIPYMGFLGVHFRANALGVVGTLPFRDENVGNPALPALHGGSIGALLEATAIAQVFWEAETLVIPKIVSLTVQYLRSGRPVDTYARCTITKEGRRVVMVRAEAWQDRRDQPIAAATAQLLVVD